MCGCACSRAHVRCSQQHSCSSHFLFAILLLSSCNCAAHTFSLTISSVGRTSRRVGIGRTHKAIQRKRAHSLNAWYTILFVFKYSRFYFFARVRCCLHRRKILPSNAFGSSVISSSSPHFSAFIVTASDASNGFFHLLSVGKSVAYMYAIGTRRYISTRTFQQHIHSSITWGNSLRVVLFIPQFNARHVLPLFAELYASPYSSVGVHMEWNRFSATSN